MQFAHSIFIFATIGGFIIPVIGTFLQVPAKVAEQQRLAVPLEELLPSAAERTFPTGARQEPQFRPQESTPSWRSRLSSQARPQGSTPSWRIQTQQAASARPNQKTTPAGQAGASSRNTPTRTTVTAGPSTPGRNQISPDEKYRLPYSFRKTGFSRQVQRSTSASKEPELIAVSLFRQKYLEEKFLNPLLDQAYKTRLVQEAFDYLFKKHIISRQELNAWVEEFIEIGNQHARIIPELHSSLFYGLLTLRIRFNQNEILKSVIDNYDVTGVIKKLESKFQPSAADMTEWDRALFSPGKGDHDSFYKNWNRILDVSPASSKNVEEAKDLPIINQEDKGIKYLEYSITSRFSKGKMEQYSSQSRLIALALLYNYSKSAHEARKQAAIQIAWSLGKNDQNNLLFHHEKVIIFNILRHYYERSEMLAPEYKDIKLIGEYGKSSKYISGQGSFH